MEQTRRLSPVLKTIHNRNTAIMQIQTDVIAFKNPSLAFLKPRLKAVLTVSY